MDIQRAGTNKRRRWRMAAVAAAGAGFLLLTVLAIGLAGRPPGVDRDGLWDGVVTRGELVHEISAAGTLVAPELRAVTNRSEGVVERILVLPGTVVEPHDVLIEMSSPQLEEDLADAHQELEAAEAERVLEQIQLEERYLDMVAAVADAETQLITQRLQLEAQLELGEAASALETEGRRLQVEQLERRLDVERARLENFDRYRPAREAANEAQFAQRKQRVARLEARVRDLNVRAGSLGVVQEINVEEGERLGAGQAVARIVNPAHLIAQVRVSERDAARVQIGMPVRVDLGRDTLRGEVMRVDPTVRDRLVTVDVALLSADSGALRPDLSVTARIQLNRIEDALILDRPAGLRDEHDTLQLFRLDRSGSRAERVTVEIGRASARQVEVLSGLDAGDRVILADMSDWMAEPLVRIR